MAFILCLVGLARCLACNREVQIVFNEWRSECAWFMHMAGYCLWLKVNCEYIKKMFGCEKIKAGVRWRL